MFELYDVGLAASGASMKLNPALAGFGVSLLRTGPDSDQVFYIADAEDFFVYELFVVDVTNPGVATTLSDPAIQAGGSLLLDFSIGPGTHAAN